MKKIVMAIVMVIAAILPVAASSQPASAEVCENRTLHAGWNVVSFDGSVQYDFDGYINYDHCASWDELNYAKYRVERVQGDCREWPPAGVDSMTLNWGDFGTWNVGPKTFSCPMAGDVVIKFSYPSSPPYIIWHGNSNRCAALYLTIVKPNAGDINKTSDQKCLS